MHGPLARLRADDIRAGIVLLDDVLKFLPALQVVVCAGRTARLAEASMLTCPEDALHCQQAHVAFSALSSVALYLPLQL